MTKIRKIVRLILACFTTVASISILSAIIYFYSDYERNVILNTNIDDYTIVFMFLAFIVFVFVSIFLFRLVFKENKKLENKSNRANL